MEELWLAVEAAAGARRAGVPILFVAVWRHMIRKVPAARRRALRAVPPQLELLAFQAIFADFFAKRFAVDSKELRRPGSVATELLQRAQDFALFGAG